LLLNPKVVASQFLGGSAQTLTNHLHLCIVGNCIFKVKIKQNLAPPPKKIITKFILKINK
jgi:hypothetical protein